MLGEDPTQPLFTWYDDATGERVELSGATLGNWMAKTANLLVDGLGLGPGDRAAAPLPPHWQTAAVLLGCRAAGLEVVGAGDTAAVDVIFAAADRLDEARVRPAGDRFVLGLAPMAMPLRAVPDGFVDYVVEVRGYGDRFPAPPSLPADAGPRAAELGIAKGDRVLIDAAVHPDPLDWLYAPLAAGATVVLCARLDRSRLAGRVAAEKVTSELV